MVYKELAVRTPEFPPSINVGNEHACAHDVRPIRPDVTQCLIDDLQAAPGLGVRVARSLHASTFRNRCAAGHVHMVARANRPTVSDLFFPRRLGPRTSYLHENRYTSLINTLSNARWGHRCVKPPNDPESIEPVRLAPPIIFVHTQATQVGRARPTI